MQRNSHIPSMPRHAAGCLSNGNIHLRVNNSTSEPYYASIGTESLVVSISNHPPENSIKAIDCPLNRKARSRAMLELHRLVGSGTITANAFRLHPDPPTVRSRRRATLSTCVVIEKYGTGNGIKAVIDSQAANVHSAGMPTALGE